jgi:hypothetical protein
MSFITRQRKSGSWELRIEHPLLDSPAYRTLDSKFEAVQFANHCHASLDKGIVPVALREATAAALRTIGEAVRKYKLEEVVARSTAKVLVSVVNDIGAVPLRETTLVWCKDWVRKQKLVWLRKPNTVRHHVIALRTIFTWVVVNYPECLATNNLLLLERAYSRCNSNEEAILLANGHELLEDTERDRRISEKEQASILQVIAQLADNAENSTERHAAHSARVIFLLALESAMRMREIYTLE